VSVAWRRVPRADYARLIDAARTVGLMTGPESHALRLFDYVQECADADHAKRRRPRSGVFAARWGCSASAAGRWMKASVDDIRSTAMTLKVDPAVCLDGERRADAAQEPGERRAGDELTRETTSDETTPVGESAAQEPGERRARAAQEPRKRRHARSSETETETENEKNNKAAGAAGLSGEQAPGKQPDRFAEVAEAWKGYRTACGVTPRDPDKTKGVGRHLAAMAKAEGVDDVVKLLGWLATSNLEVAGGPVFYRTNKNGADTVRRHFEKLSELMSSDRPSTPVDTRAPGEIVKAERERMAAARKRRYGPKRRPGETR
jgi:hypothetical protein